MHNEFCVKFNDAHRRLPLIGHYLLLTAHRSLLTAHYRPGAVGELVGYAGVGGRPLYLQSGTATNVAG